MRELERKGWLVARLLAGAWRHAPPKLVCTEEEFRAAAPFLLASGAGALVWSRIADSPLRATAAGQALQQACRSVVVHNLRSQHHLAELLPAFFQAGLDPLLIKGQALAPLYARPELRPCGDLDISVPPRQFAPAYRWLRENPALAAGVDLHQGCPDLPGRAWAQLRDRASTLIVGRAAIRVMGREDQFRHLCLHQARHGCWRPLWLCDAAAALEQADADFDWDYCLAGPPRQTRWVLCVIGLARQLLGARLLFEPRQLRHSAPPAWIRDQILRGWGHANSGDSHTRDDQPVLNFLESPRRLLPALRARWPNQVEAVFKAGGVPETRRPIHFYQLLVSGRRFLDLLRRHTGSVNIANVGTSQAFSLHP